MLLQEFCEIGISEAILRPMLVSDNISRFGSELGMPITAPSIDCESLLLLCLDLRRINVQPAIKIIVACPMVRNDEDLDPGRPYRWNKLSHVFVVTDRICSRFGYGIELAAFAHEIVVGIND